MNEPQDTPPPEDAQERADAAGQPPALEAQDALARAVALWRRRGYRLRYEDAYLAQLTRRGAPAALPLALGLLAIVGIGAWWFAGRTWLVVSISAAPDGRLVVHRQRSRRPPPV